jgi:hypothetical protein
MERVALDLSRNRDTHERSVAQLLPRNVESEFREQPIVFDDHARTTGEKRQDGELERVQLNRPALNRRRAMKQIEDETTITVGAGRPDVRDKIGGLAARRRQYRRKARLQSASRTTR